MSTQRLPYERAAILRFLLALQFVLVELPRWLLLAVIVYAPWAFGCTRWWAKTLLIQSLLAITLLWLCSLFLRRRWPRVTVPVGRCRAVAFGTWLVFDLQLAGKLR